MLGALDSGLSGLLQYQQGMNVIGNNVANVNTIGFKSGRQEMADSFSQTLSSLSSDIVSQIGHGVETSAIYNQFTQGEISSTGVQTDIAISGEGFFNVQDPVSGNTYATRAGDFRIDSKGYLVTVGGYQVLGTVYSKGTGTADSPVQINDIVADRPGTVSSSAAITMQGYTIASDGTVSVQLSDGTSYTRDKITLQNYLNPQALTKDSANLYSNLAAAGPMAASVTPGTNGTGTLQDNALELSNVDLAREFTNMITTQQAFNASSKIITTGDQMLQVLVNLKQ